MHLWRHVIKSTQTGRWPLPSAVQRQPKVGEQYAPAVRYEPANARRRQLRQKSSLAQSPTHVFSGFTSRWMMFSACKYSSASSIGWMTSRTARLQPR